MRPVLGFLAAHVALMAPGFALLWALGLLGDRAQVRGWRTWALAIGPAYLAGVALTAIVVQLLLVLGLTVSLGLTVLVIAALTGGAVLVGVRFGRPAPPRLRALAPRSTAERALVWLGAATTVAFFVLGSRTFDQLPSQVDDARIWSLRTLGLFFYGHLQEDVFTGAPYGPSHHDYPLLVPILDSTIYRFMGGEDLRLAHLELWICVAAFAWTVAWALAPGRRILAWLPMVVVLPILTPVIDNVALGNVDPLVAGFSAAGALLVALWLEDGRRAHALLGAVLLGGAACTKNEGLVTALIVVALAGIVLLVRRDGGPRVPRLRSWLPVLGVVLLAIVPWQLWIAATGVENTDVPGLSTTLDPSYLSDRWDRLERAFERLFTVFGNQGVWLWVLPLFLALTVALLVTGRGRLRALASYYLAGVLLFFLALLWVFWTGRLEIQFHLDTAADRVSMTFMILALVGLAHLASSLVREREREEAAAAGPGATPAGLPAGRPPGAAAARRAGTSAGPAPPAT